MSVLNQVPAGGPTVPPGGMEMSEFYKGHWVSQETSQPTIVQAFGIMGTIFWMVRLAMQIARNYQRGSIIEFSGNDFVDLGRRCGLGERLLSIVRFLASMSSLVLIPLGAMGMHFAIAHAFGSFYPLIMVIQLHLNVAMLMIVGCQDLSSFFVKRGEWDVKRAAWTFLGIIPVLLICSAMYELFTISMALDSSHCFGQSGSGFVNGEGVPNPCAVNMGIIAAVTVGLNWIPLFLESNRHQGRSVSVNGMGLLYGIVGAHLSSLAVYFRNRLDVEGVAIFTVIATCETMLGLAHVVWLLRTRKMRAEAASAGLTFDELMDVYVERGGPLTFVASRRCTHVSFSTPSAPYTAPPAYTVSPISSADVEDHHNRVWRRLNAYLEDEQPPSQRVGSRRTPQQRQGDEEGWVDIPLQDMRPTFGGTVMRPEPSHAGTRAHLDDYDDGFDQTTRAGYRPKTRAVSPRQFL